MHVFDGVEILRTTAEFEALAPEWKELWLRDERAKPFQRPEWLLPWWRQFGQPDLLAVCLRQAGVLVGLIPLYVYAAGHERQMLLVGAGTSDYLDGVFAPECTDDAIRAGMWAMAAEAAWEVAHLPQMLPESRLYGVLGEMFPEGRYVSEPCSRCAAGPIAGLPKKVRAEVLYFRNAAIGRGKLRLQIADAETWEAGLEALVRLHSARWTAAGEAGVLADPLVLAWHREAVPALLGAGCLRLYVLLLEEEPVAALYGLIDPAERAGRTAYFYLIGYSPAHAAFKPGTLLTAMASEHAAAEGVRVLDMLRGDETYKKFWHVEEVATFGFTFRRKALVG